MKFYRPDLAFIHDDGFGQLATAGAKVLIEELERRRLSRGTILDLGCGSGITAHKLTEKGYSVSGIDMSEALIEMARKRAPEATFRVGSFVEMDIPPCIAICALGEVLNYAFDSQNNAATRKAFFERAFQGLVEGGFLLFDVAGLDRAHSSPTRTFTEGKDWTVLMEASAEADVLVRKIVTFRQSGSVYNRDSEIHQLQLVAPEDIESELRAVGFSLQRLDGYSELLFPLGLYGFVAWRPTRAA